MKYALFSLVVSVANMYMGRPLRILVARLKGDIDESFEMTGQMKSVLTMERTCEKVYSCGISGIA